MKKRFRPAMTAVLLTGVLAGCASGRSADGALIGAFASSQDEPVATRIVEAMAGGLVGRAVREGLDERDRRRALEAEYRALEYTPVGQTVEWGRRGSRLHGEVRAGAPYRVGSQDCRQYMHTVHVGGQSRSIRGTACRNDDGSWTPIA